MFFLYHLNMFSYVELKPRFLIGRAEGDLVFETDQRMSGSHLEITYSPEERLVYVEDLGSKNHTVVNRIQIPSNEKIRVKIFALIEAGSQQFILTDTKSLTIQNINEIMDHHLQKAIVKLDKDRTSTHSAERIYQPDDELSLDEAEIKKITKEIDSLETSVKQSIQKLEEQKQLVLQNAQKKKKELQMKLQNLKSEFEHKKNNFQKVRDDLEQKKKKIINLNTLESTKEPSK